MPTSQSEPFEYPSQADVAAFGAATQRGGGRGPSYNGGGTNVVLWPGAQGIEGAGGPLGAPGPRYGKTTVLDSRGNAFRYVIEGADGPGVLFSPQQPLQPTSQDPSAGVVGRPWDYPVGYNTRVTPRSNEKITFGTLKALADGFDILRILIERAKDKVISQEWGITPKKKGAKRDSRCDDLEAFFAMPDQRRSTKDWLRLVLEQLFVYDAVSIWLRPDRGGDLYSLEVMDGSLFSPKIDATGRVPDYDAGIAYQEVLKNGMPCADYIRPVPFAERAQTPLIAGSDWPMPELLYAPRNVRIDTPYGFSPVEQIITTVNIALAREAYLQGYYTKGSTPDLLISAPANWQPKQIAEFQAWWDGMMNGNLDNRKGARFIPDGTKVLDTKDKALTDETDQWLIRIMCFAFGLNPMPFIKSMNKGQEKTHHDEAQSEGSEVWKAYVQDLFNQIIVLKFGYTDLQFTWEEEDATDPLERAQINQILVQNGIKHPDEIREQDGDGPMPANLREQMDQAPFNPMAQQATVLPPDQQADQQAATMAINASKPAPVMPGAPGSPTAGGPSTGPATGKPAAPGPSDSKAAPAVAAKLLGKGSRSWRSIASVDLY